MKNDVNDHIICATDGCTCSITPGTGEQRGRLLFCSGACAAGYPCGHADCACNEHGPDVHKRKTLDPGSRIA